jgi:hypothetical protein
MENLRRKIRKMKTLGRLLLIASFTIAGSVKLSNISEFELALTSYGFIPECLIALIAHTTPVLEIITGILLLLPKNELTGYTLSTILCLCFCISLILGLELGSISHCGCFGSMDLAKASPQTALIRACALLMLSIVLWVKTFKEETV